MAQRFISKNTRRKYIRPVRNTMLNNRVEVAERKAIAKPDLEEVKPELVEAPVLEKKTPKRSRKKTVKKEEPAIENNEQNTEPMNENIEKIKQIVGQDAEIPEQKVKYEKKDKGLIERTENSTILITEENKMLLND